MGRQDKEISGDKQIDLIARNITQTLLRRWKNKPVERIRPKLGDEVHIFDLQMKIFGSLLFSEAWSGSLYLGGQRYGKSTAHYLTLCPEIDQYIREIRKMVKKGADIQKVRNSHMILLLKGFFEINKSGLLELEKINKKRVVFTLEECAECYGSPNFGRRICYFTTGYLTGFMSAIMDTDFQGHETKCIAMNDKICEFMLSKSVV